jgi:integrase/recombinase XerD
MDLEKTVQHFLKDAKLKRRTENTLYVYSHSLSVLSRLLREKCGVTDLERVTIFHLRECAQYLSTPEFVVEDRQHRSSTRKGRPPVAGMLSDTSVRSYVRVWKAFFGWCFREELIEKNVSARLSLPQPEHKVIPAFTDEHVEGILNSFDRSTDIGFRNYVMVLLFLDTGIRVSELASLQVGDVHDDYIKVFGKGRKEREVGIFPEVGKLLWKYVNKYRKPFDPDETALFLTRSGKPLRNYTAYVVIKQAGLLTGIEGIRVSPHTFRHTFAKVYLEQGGDLFKLSRELGHNDIQTTRKYLESFGSTEARKDHVSYSPIARLRLNKRKQDRRRK